MDARYMMSVAKELMRSRLLTRDETVERDMKSAYAEVYLLAQYDRLPTLNDLRADRKKVTFITEDLASNTVRVISFGKAPFHVYESGPKADRYVFIQTGKQAEDCTILGWITRSELEEIDRIETRNRWGKTDYHFEVIPEFLVRMPDVFQFEDKCPHFDEYNGMWNDELFAWECFGCGRLLPNRSERERIGQEDTKSE